MDIILGTQEELMSDSQTNRRLSQLTVSEEEDFGFLVFVHLDWTLTTMNVMRLNETNET
jgi:hypothetical protein